MVVVGLLPGGTQPSDHQQLQPRRRQHSVRHPVEAPFPVQRHLVKADDAEALQGGHPRDCCGQHGLGSLDDSLGDAETTGPDSQRACGGHREFHDILDVAVRLAADAPQSNSHSYLLGGPVEALPGGQAPHLLGTQCPGLLQLGDGVSLLIQASDLRQERGLLPSPLQPPGLQQRLLAGQALLQQPQPGSGLAALSASDTAIKERQCQDANAI